MVNENRLTAAMGLVYRFTDMTKAIQLINYGTTKAAFHLHLAVLRHQAGQINGLLNIQAEFKVIRQEVAMACWLIAPAHHAIGHDGAAILHHHAGDDGMQRALIGRDAIRVAFLQAEAETAILQHDTGFFRKDA
jgi:hypothetical protein